MSKKNKFTVKDGELMGHTALTPSALAQMEETAQGIPCHYVRFHQAVPAAKDKEPVSEFYTKGPTTKYLVESIVYTPFGVVYKAYGEENIVPLANVIYVRTTKQE